MHTQVKHTAEIIKELQDVPEEQLPNLLNLIRIFKKSLTMQMETDLFLKQELEEWDILSNEALSNFETNLS